MVNNARKMIHNIYVAVAACIIVTNLAESVLAAHDTTNIFNPPEDSEISDIQNNSLPWVKSEYISTIQEFKDNVFAGLQSSPQVQKIWNIKTDGKTARDAFFTVLNNFFTKIDHPVPTALANVVSKSVSLFDPLTSPIRFEAVAINLAEFLLVHDMDVDKSTADRYVGLLSSALETADVDDPKSLLQADLDAYTGFVKSFGFDLAEEVDELFLLFASEMIVLKEK